ncbi:MAG: HAD hydrolase-like protein, partial [Clostridia bacterium]|nr:HAD hydrolase-like protein [Clostridia bacterium]
MIEKAIFDLDGTLLDTSPGILESVRYSLGRYGFPEPPLDDLLTFVGPPLVDSYMRVCGCSREDAEKLTAAYREYYPTGPMFNALPYDGIYDILRELKGSGLILSIATSKPTVFSSRVAARFGFDRFMSGLEGADLAGVLSKADLIMACVRD